MLSVGLTGGIGSGKSTFAKLLEERGATIIDADDIGRAALEPGQRAWREVVDQFGDEILVPGTIEVSRARLAEVVFKDPARLAALNAITHPRIFEQIAETFEMLRNTHEIVILDAALLVGTGLEGVVEMVIVVDAPQELRRERLVGNRAMTPEDVDARIQSQLPSSELLERADLVVLNDGDQAHLAAEADRVWTALVEKRDA
jgi:dephospho-CoA kinase